MDLSDGVRITRAEPKQGSAGTPDGDKGLVDGGSSMTPIEGFVRLNSGGFRPTDARDLMILGSLEGSTIGGRLTPVSGATLEAPPAGIVWIVDGNCIRLAEKRGN